jgi:hypothetical protein
MQLLFKSAATYPLGQPAVLHL